MKQYLIFLYKADQDANIRWVISELDSNEDFTQVKSREVRQAKEVLINVPCVLPHARLAERNVIALQVFGRLKVLSDDIVQIISSTED